MSHFESRGFRLKAHMAIPPRSSERGGMAFSREGVAHYTHPDIEFLTVWTWARLLKYSARVNDRLDPFCRL